MSGDRKAPETSRATVEGCDSLAGGGYPCSLHGGHSGAHMASVLMSWEDGSDDVFVYVGRSMWLLPAPDRDEAMQ